MKLFNRQCHQCGNMFTTYDISETVCPKCLADLADMYDGDWE